MSTSTVHVCWNSDHVECNLLLCIASCDINHSIFFLGKFFWELPMCINVFTNTLVQ